TRVRGEGDGPPADKASLEFVGEEQVGELGLAVRADAAVAPAPLQVVEVDVGANPVPDAADGDDPGAWCFEHALEEESGESEMPEVIGAELHLEPVGGELFGRVHDAGVV